MTTRLPFTELAMRRAIRAARSEGVRVAAVTVGPDGSITIHDADSPVAAVAGRAQHVEPSDFKEFQA